MGESAGERTIQAYVAREALGKVTRMFDASAGTTARELLQNARRAGASAVEVTTDDAGEGTYRATVRDDGCGIADPAILLAFGRSGWGETLKGEDPAGLGMVALARERVRITSTARGQGGAREAFTVTLGPEHFAGEAPATVHTCAPGTHTGTVVSWTGRGNATEVADAWRRAARYAPLAVEVNGAPAERERFLEGAVRTSTWRGAEIGVYEGRPSGTSGCWFGVEIGLGIDAIITADAKQWYARADVSGYKGIELVLPGRGRVVENYPLRTLRAAARTAMLTTMIDTARRRGTPLRLPKREFDYARRAGAKPPALPPALVAFDLEEALEDEMMNQSWRRHGAERWEALPEGEAKGWIVTQWDSTEERGETGQLAFARERGWCETPPLWREARACEGYAWYDALAVIERVEPMAVVGGERTALATLHREGRFDADALEGLALDVTLERRQGGRVIKRWTESVEVPAAIAPDAGVWYAGGDPAVADPTRVEAEALVALLEAAYLRYDDDVEEYGSSEAQALAFEEAAQASAERVLAGPEFQLGRSFGRAAERALANALPEGRTGTVRVEGARVRAHLDPVPGAQTPRGAARETLERLSALHLAWSALELGPDAEPGSGYARQAERDARAMVHEITIWGTQETMRERTRNAAPLAGGARWRLCLHAGAGSIEIEGPREAGPHQVQIGARDAPGAERHPLESPLEWGAAGAWLAKRMGAR